MVASTVQGLDIFDAVHFGILPLPIQFLLPFMGFGVPPFSVRSGCIHALIQANEWYTRPPTLVVSGRDSLWPVAAWHVGPAAAASGARGVGGSSPGYTSAQRPRSWFGTVGKLLGWPLGLLSPVRGSVLVWAVWAVSAFSGPPALPVSVAIFSLCFSNTTHASLV